MCVCVCVTMFMQVCSGVFDMAHLCTVATSSQLCCSHYAASMLEKNNGMKKSSDNLAMISSWAHTCQCSARQFLWLTDLNSSTLNTSAHPGWLGCYNLMLWVPDSHVSRKRVLY